MKFTLSPEPISRRRAAPIKARRSRYRLPHRLVGAAPAWVIAALLIGVLAITSVAAGRAITFLRATTNSNVNSVIRAVAPQINPYPPGSIGYHLEHKDQVVNVLVLGYGGQENDAPYLSDTIMIVRFDPVTKRVALISVPRDLYVKVYYGPNGQWSGQKVNAAFAIGVDESGLSSPKYKDPKYTGRDGGGRLAEDTLTRITGIKFDGYVAVDFKAFRDVVNALGGVTVHMDDKLDDCHYPDYHNGYLNGGVPENVPCPYARNPNAGIHYPAGTYVVTGEQALQIARSRHADEADQATDFGRARRQQMLVAAIKERAVSVNGIIKAPQLMDALQRDFKTDLRIDDLKALYDFGKSVPQEQVLHYALTDSDFLDSGACGNNDGLYYLCPADPTYIMIKEYFAHSFPPASLTTTHSPLQIAWTGYAFEGDIGDSVTAAVKPFGFNVVATAKPRVREVVATTIYDFSNGQNPDQAAFLSDLITSMQSNGHQVTIVPGAQAPAWVSPNNGFVVVLGSEFGNCWYGYGPPRCTR